MYYPYRLIQYPSLASNVLHQLVLVLEISTLSEIILRAQEMFVFGAQGGHVACATEMWDRAT